MHWLDIEPFIALNSFMCLGVGMLLHFSFILEKKPMIRVHPNCNIMYLDFVDLLAV